MFFKKKPYSVKLRGKSKVIYSEGIKKMNLYYEMTAGEGIVLYDDELERWDAPDDKITISDEKRSQIKKNISEGLGKHKIPVVWS